MAAGRALLDRGPPTKKIESVIKNLLANKSPGPNGFMSEFYQIFEEGLMSTMFRLIQKIEEDGILPNSFYEASITLMPKPHIDATRKYP